MKKCLGLFAVLLMASFASASTAVVTIHEAFTFADFGGVPISSFGAAGDAGNTVIPLVATGGYTPDVVRISGTVEATVASGNWISDAVIGITSANGFTQARGQIGGGAATIGDTFTFSDIAESIGYAIDPGETLSFEFYERSGFDEGVGIDDNVWNDVTVEFVSTVVTDGSFALGSVGVGSSLVDAGHSNVSGGLDFYTLTLADAVDLSNFLHIGTVDGGTEDSIDTEIAIYDASGSLIANDDDGGPGTYSLLTFGGLAPGSIASEDGTSLPAGDYTVVVGSYNTDYGTVGDDIGTIVPGTSSAGDYQLVVEFGTAVPEPSTFALLGMAILGLLAYHKRS